MNLKVFASLTLVLFGTANAVPSFVPRTANAVPSFVPTTAAAKRALSIRGGMLELPEASFDHLSGPFSLTADSSKTDGLFESPGVTTTGIGGQTVDFGKVSQGVTIKDGVISLGDTTIKILGGSLHVGNRTLSTKKSVTILPSTVTFVGSDKDKGELIFTDDKAKEEAKKMIESGNDWWEYEEVKEDPGYDNAEPMKSPTMIKIGSSKSLKLSLKLKIKIVGGSMTVVQTYEVTLSIRPKYGPKPKKNKPDKDRKDDNDYHYYPQDDNPKDDKKIKRSKVEYIGSGAMIGLGVGAGPAVATTAYAAGAAYLGLAAKGAAIGASVGPLGALVGGVVGAGVGFGAWFYVSD